MFNPLNSANFRLSATTSTALNQFIFGLTEPDHKLATAVDEIGLEGGVKPHDQRDPEQVSAALKATSERWKSDDSVRVPNDCSLRRAFKNCSTSIVIDICEMNLDSFRKNLFTNESYYQNYCISQKVVDFMERNSGFDNTKEKHVIFPEALFLQSEKPVSEMFLMHISKSKGWMFDWLSDEDHVYHVTVWHYQVKV